MKGFLLRLPPPLLGVLPTKVDANVKTHHHHHPPPPPPTTTRANAVGARSKVDAPPGQGKPSWASFKQPSWRLWPEEEEEVGGGETTVEEGCHGEESAGEGERGQRGNWVANILLVKSMWGRWKGGGNGVGLIERGKEGAGDGGVDEAITRQVEEGGKCVGCCEVEEEIVFDQRSFSKLLRRVSLAEASLYSRLSYLGLLAYYIPKIKCGNLLGSHGLKFVTSSLERRSVPADVISEEQPNFTEEETAVDGENKKNGVTTISAAYKIAASAASYVQSHTKNILSLGNSKGDLDMDFASMIENVGDILSYDESLFLATTNSVTAVVAAEEEVKEAVAKDLNSPWSSPCDWFICDDESSRTRYFVIQGSESVASWQANLFFEPIQFEGLDFVVHRGIYEAAKGIYEQMLPEIRSHLKSHGKLATLQFTGHSLGGSLSLLVNLMLLIRGEVPASSLLPVVTFGAPTILCGGNQLLQKLGLPLNHVKAILMHRDIVPRAFSCNYPDHVAEILKALNKNFRNHPCLSNKKLLYEAMGEFLILQPDEKSSPHHHLLPSGSGLYALANPDASRGLIHAAQSFFLNSPHPLEILSKRAAYGSDGTVTRNHDMKAYVRSVQGLIEVEVKRIRRAEIERRGRMWAPLVVVEGDGDGDGTRWQQPAPAAVPSGMPPQPVRFAGVEPLRRFGRLVASQHVQMLVVVMLPARVLITTAVAVVNLS